MENGSEFNSKRLDSWACINGLELDLSGCAESTGNVPMEVFMFNGQIPQEHPTESLFLPREDYWEKVKLG